MRRERITRADLDLAIGALNRELGRANGLPGAYDVVGAYGGWQLVTIGPAPACGAVDHAPVPVGHGYHPRRAVYDAVQAIRHGLALGRQANAPADAVAVHVPRADADTLADALYTAAERAASDAEDHPADDDPETAEELREHVAALDRLADAIAAAVRQEGPAL